MDSGTSGNVTFALIGGTRNSDSTFHTAVGTATEALTAEQQLNKLADDIVAAKKNGSRAQAEIEKFADTLLPDTGNVISARTFQERFQSGSLFKNLNIILPDKNYNAASLIRLLSNWTIRQAPPVDQNTTNQKDAIEQEVAEQKSCGPIDIAKMYGFESEVLKDAWNQLAAREKFANMQLAHSSKPLMLSMVINPTKVLQDATGTGVNNKKALGALIYQKMASSYSGCLDELAAVISKYYGACSFILKKDGTVRYINAAELKELNKNVSQTTPTTQEAVPVKPRPGEGSAPDQSAQETEMKDWG